MRDWRSVAQNEGDGRMRELVKHSTGRWLRLGCLTLALGCGGDDVDTGEIIEEIGGDGDADGEQMSGDGEQISGDGDQPGEGDGDMPDPMEEPTDPDAGPTGDGDGDPVDAGGTKPMPSEAFLRGEALAVEHECADCHVENFGGGGFYPNITPDATGIGKWTDAQIAKAINDGVGNDGKTLCASMPKFKLSAGDTADLIEYLRGLPAVKKTITAICPGHGK